MISDGAEERQHCVKKEEDVLTKAPTRIHVVAGSFLQEQKTTHDHHLRYDGYKDSLVGVLVEEGVESVEHIGTGRQREPTPALRMSEKVWTRAPLTLDAEVSASHVSWKESGVQAASYEDEEMQQKGGKERLSTQDAMHRLGMMLFQNHDSAAYRDFLSWNDPVDDCQPTHGSLLPLWEAVCEKGTPVTSFCWHPGKDGNIFAAGLGSLNHDEFTTGSVCIYSMFDMHLPRHTISTRATVTCVSFSPDGQYLAMGLHDGGLAVWSYDDPSLTLLESDIGMHHVFPVWSIRWEDAPDVVVTIGQDGMEGVWTFADKVLERTGSRIIGIENSQHEYDPYVFLQNRIESDHVLNMVCSSAKGAGVHLYGTLEGGLLSCCDTSIVKNSYHKGPVYSVSVNPFDDEYMMAASLDWSVSLWKSSALDKVLLDIDVGEPIVDAQWSLRSSTIFAVATETGNVYVYDLAIRKEVPLCQQRVCGTASLTFVRFHNKHPVIFAGTSDGRVICLKLSPNLRSRKENDDGNDFAFLDEDAHAYTERPILGLEEQRQSLHDALAHPF